MATEYILLLQDHDDPTRFTLRDVVEVEHGPTQAVRAHVDAHGDGSNVNGDMDVYIAVPVRNWSVVPRRVTVPAPRVTVEEADSRQFLTQAMQSVVANAAPVEVVEEAEALHELMTEEEVE